jgi:hypothetical protein
MLNERVYMSNVQYVKEMLDSKLFNLGTVEDDTKVSRYIMAKIKKGDEVKPYFVDALANYFKSLSNKNAGE